MKKTLLLLTVGLISAIGFNVIQNEYIHSNALQEDLSFSFSRFTLDEAVYVNSAGGTIKYYRYTYTIKPSTFSSSDMGHLSLSDPVFIQLPLSGLNYQHNVNVPLNFSIQYMSSTIYSLTPKTYEPLIHDLVTIDFPSIVSTSTYKFIFNIPTTDTSGLPNFQNALNQFGVIHTDASGYLYLSDIYDNNYYQGFQDGQTEGYINGYDVGTSDGYNNGYEVGNSDGYSIGFTDGINEDEQLVDFFGLLKTGFSSMNDIFNIEVLPNLTIGTLLFFPVIFGVGFALIKLLVK